VDQGDRIAPESCRQQANKFTPEVFRNAYSLFIEEQINLMVKQSQHYS
jgi:hypothetical protein